MIIPISDVAGLRLRPFRAVSDQELASRERGLTAEGRKVVRRLLDTRPAYRVRSLLVSGSHWRGSGRSWPPLRCRSASTTWSTSIAIAAASTTIRPARRSPPRASDT